MRAERIALNRDTLPFIDLHQERRAQQWRSAALNVKRLIGLTLLLTLQAGILLPLTLEALSYRPRLARAQKALAAAESRLKTVTQARAGLDPLLKKRDRYELSRASRQQIAATLQTTARALPPEIYIEHLQISVKDKQTQIQIQGVAQTQAALRDGMKALANAPQLGELHLTETSDALIAGKRVVHFRAEATQGGP